MIRGRRVGAKVRHGSRREVWGSSVNLTDHRKGWVCSKNLGNIGGF